MTKPIFAAFLLMFVGCSSKSDPATTPDASAPVEAGPPAATDAVNASLACTDPGVPPSPPGQWTANLKANTVERCIYQGTSLSVQLEGSQFFHLGIETFNGPGTYTADQADGTFVSVRAQGALGGNSPGDVTDVATSSDECAATCTITVTEATVKDAPVGGTGTFVATVDCPKLAGGAVGCVTCVPSPSAIARISIPSCNHDE